MPQFTEADSAVNRLNAAVSAFEKVLTEPEGTVVEMPVGAAQPSLAERLKRAIDSVTVKPAQAASQATTAAQQAQAAQQSAAQSAADAANSAAATGYVAPPFPDVWAPLNDDLRLLAGFAPADTIPGTSYTLPSKSMSFTRASTATYIDKSGVLRTAAINEPRFEKEGLLIEGQSTNLALYSGDLSNAWWPKTRSSVITGFDAPDGSKSGCKLIANTEASSHYISKPYVVAANTVYCWSIFVKAGEYTNCRLNFSGVVTTDAMTCDFDLTAGIAKAATANAKPSITPLGNGWYRITATSESFTTSGSANFNIWITDGSGASQGAGDDVKGFYVWGAQIEANDLPTSYIPTIASTATRAAETNVSLQVSNNCGYYKVGDRFNRTVAFELTVNGFSPGAAGYFDILRCSGVSADIILRAGSDRLSSFRSSGNISPSISASYPLARQMFVETIDTNDKLTVYYGGQSGSRTAPPTNPDGIPTSIDFSSSSRIVYHIRNFRIWHRVLSDIQIKGLR